ncbi:MAG TPA: HigA family addiction module antitoxin [Desulfobacteraceae bacterium]|nr:HigA family addiction module antitoxin [Desulfobacteraceae bacterium]HPJ69009.1 HigA family addiction module antitoxin [Desulfobacteraceae bacterium]HPQ29474.1 HigA family addiction module antitoxin [Desulfobacteraceae bacterium]
MIQKGLPPIHPGKYLKEILDELCISQADFARGTGLSTMRISLVIRGKRPVTAEMALIFGKAFGQTPQYWLNLQAAYDLKIAERSIGSSLIKIQPVFHA